MANGTVKVSQVDVLTTSGTGTISIVPPATNTNRTLTLPDQTATVATLTTPSFGTTIGVGGATASSSGAGVTFPATQSASTDANTLDDYEEGTFTPAFAFGGGSTGITYDEQLGNYVKIGQYVYCSIVLSLSNKGSSTGNMTLTGLPFTIANLTSNRASGLWTYTYNGTTITGSPTFLGAANTTNAEIYQSGTSTAITNSNIQNTTAMRGFIAYRASA